MIVWLPAWLLNERMERHAEESKDRFDKVDKRLEKADKQLDRVHKDIAAMHTERLNEWHEQHYKH